MRKPVYLLWNGSRIWGLMALRAIKALELPCQLVKSWDIAQGGILGKTDAILLVPGGNARQKAASLGQAGLDKIRAWLLAGGSYIGFCGGAGLALTHDSPEQGLGICPWRRGAFSQRLFHLMSGHVLAGSPSLENSPLPVWWPGRFAADKRGDVEILANYIAPGPDLWLADMPLAKVPRKALAMCQRVYGIDLAREFPSGQPLVIGGKFGKGRYILSYAHLETPQSPEANRFLASLLGVPVSGLTGASWATTAHDPPALPLYAPDIGTALKKAQQAVSSLMRAGEELGLFFKRTDWLWGWRSGIGGMACNNLLAALATLADTEMRGQPLRLWASEGRNFCDGLENFLAEAETHLWASRMGSTLEMGLLDEARPFSRKDQSAKLFGHPMLGGGKVEALLGFLDELAYLCYS